MVPLNHADDQFWHTFIFDAITMTNEEITTLLLFWQSEMIDGTMTGCLVLLFVAFNDERAASVEHGLAFTVEIGPGDRPASADDHAVVAFHAAAAVVMTDKEIVPPLMLEDERGFNGIGTGKVRSGIGRKGLRAFGIAACNGKGTRSGSSMKRRVEAQKLNAVPKRAVGQPRLAVVVNDEVGVYGIPVVTSLARGDDAALIAPTAVVREAVGGEQSDG